MTSMKELLKIRANFKIGNLAGQGHGELQIEERDKWTIPITWQLYTEDGTLLAFSGLSIYVGENEITKEQIRARSKDDIENYRSGRMRPFSQVEIY